MPNQFFINIKNLFLKSKAFIRKDFYLNLSYRVPFIMNCTSIFFVVAIFFFISKTLGNKHVMLGYYRGEYFSFIIIGIAFFNYFFTSLDSFSKAIRYEQLIGTLEIMLISPTRLPTIIILLGLWSFIYSSFIVALYLFFGSVFFNLNINWLNLPATLPILIPSIIACSSFGIISASFVLIFKNNDPIKWFISTGFSFLGGVFFPIETLPSTLQYFSRFIPITYSLRALRLVLLKNASFSDLLPEFIIIVLFSVVFIPFSIIIFKFAVMKARKDGSLVHF